LDERKGEGSGLREEQDEGGGVKKGVGGEDEGREGRSE
jgi:hypothetical protein